MLDRHAREVHQGKVPDFTMNVSGVYNNDAMLRQIAESIRIRKDGDINNKKEWKVTASYY